LETPEFKEGGLGKMKKGSLDRKIDRKRRMTKKRKEKDI